MTQSRVLADQWIPGEGLLSDAARVLVGNLLLILCAQIAIPLSWTPVPITGQTFGVLLVAVLLGARRSALVLGIYLLEGAAGLPVFQPFGWPGAARMLGPTAGYLWSYPLAAYVTGRLVEVAFGPGDPGSGILSREVSGIARMAQLSAALLAGEAIIFTGGVSWLAVVSQASWQQALATGLVPFIPGELVKMALVVAAAGSLEIAGRRGQNS